MPAKSSHSDARAQLACLHDMLESAGHIARYMDGVTFDAFWEDSEKRDAVAMRLSVIGEAARHITKETEGKLAASGPGLPFKDIRGMRNRIAHDYGRVDYRVVWQVTQESIPSLVAVIERYLSNEKSK